MTPDQLERLIAEAEQRETMRLARTLAILELRTMGMSYRAIGAVLGLSFAHVRRICVSFVDTASDMGE